MIPAILSCLFVIYMYRALNCSESESSSSSGAASPDTNSISELIDRLSGLHKRLDALSRNDQKGAGQ